MATITGQRARSTLPARDTPGIRRSAARTLLRRPPALPPRRRRGGRSRPRWPVRRTSGSRVTAAAPTRPGTPGRCPPNRRASRARSRSSIPASATGRMLVLDLDVSRAGRAADGAAVHDDRQRGAVEVATQALAIAELVARCGGQVLADVAPRGGRHIYVLFAAALPWRELRDLCRAMALRFPSIDPAPMSSLGGQISPARLEAQERRLAGAVYARRHRPGGRGAAERARGVERAADRVRGRAAQGRESRPGGKVPSWTTPASRGCPASAAARRSA